MEDVNKASRAKVCPKLAQTGRLSARLPNNLISRLQYRELGGIHKHHRQSVSRVFHKLPVRLGFSLRCLVHESVLREGHVFLGFSKDGQFVLSYTLHLEADDHIAYPMYIYRLQWWHFIPYKPLRKVSEVRLFGDEEIQQDLLLNICEWSDSSTKIVVHGYCVPSDNEEKRQCYITITAVPPVHPCEDCINLAACQTQSGRSIHQAPSRCLLHGFAVHSKYELAPPYPIFAPKIFLKLDGVLVVNTGDSLVALSVQIEEGRTDLEGGIGGGVWGLCSPRVAPSESYASSNGASPVSSVGAEEKFEEDPLCGLMQEAGCSAGPLYSSLLACNIADQSSPPPSTTSGHHTERRLSKDSSNPACSEHRTRHLSSGREHQAVTRNITCLSPQPSTSRTAVTLPDVNSGGLPGCHGYSGSFPGCHGYSGSLPGCRDGRCRAVLRSSDAASVLRTQKSPLDVYNFDSGTPKKDDSVGSPECVAAETDGKTSVNGRDRTRANIATSRSGASRAATGYTSTEEEDEDLTNLDELSVNGANNDDGSSVVEGAGSKRDLFEKPCAYPRLQVRSDGVTIVPQRLLPNLSLLAPSSSELYVIRSGNGMVMSPGYSGGGGRWEHGGSSTCSSCISSPIILQNESKCFTFSVRRYVESAGNPRPESPVDVEEDLYLAYHILLPLEVHGSGYCNMKLVQSQCYVPLTPCVAVKQLTLDIEHYLGEAVKTCADWGHRYLAFTDYDVQILEVCPDTAEVTAIVFVLIRARSPKEPHKQHLPGRSRSVPKLYDTGFKFAWNLQTGTYRTLGVKDLVEVNQAELLRTKQWHPGHNFHRITEALHQKCAVPLLHHQTVHVLTNEAVFKGLSLKMLLDRQLYSVILL